MTIGVIDAGAGPSDGGLLADNGGLLVNGTATAFILGGSGVVVGAGAETVSNAGGIVALGTAKSSCGLFLASGGVVVNAAGGTIGSLYGFGVATGTTGSTVLVNNGAVLGNYGIVASDPATIINTGTIGGTTAAIVLGGAANIVDFSPTAVLLGAV